MNTRPGIGRCHHGGHPIPTYAQVDPLSITCMRTWSSPRNTVAARSPQRSSTVANRSWPTSAPTSAPNWANSMAKPTTCTYSCTTHRKSRCLVWSTASKVFPPAACARNFRPYPQTPMRRTLLVPLLLRRLLRRPTTIHRQELHRKPETPHLNPAPTLRADTDNRDAIPPSHQRPGFLARAS
jgi:hypothetical protein